MVLDTLWGIYSSPYEIYISISFCKLCHLCSMNFMSFVFHAPGDIFYICTLKWSFFVRFAGRYVPPYWRKKLRYAYLLFKKSLWKFRIILRLRSGGVDENICMSLTHEAMGQTKPQYWQGWKCMVYANMT